MSVLETKKDIVRRFLDDAVAGKDDDVAREMLSEDYLRHDDTIDSDERGPEPFLEMMHQIYEGFPDMDLTYGEMIGEGDLIAFEGVMSGTHEGEFMGIEATGKPISVRGNAMHRVSDGQIVESWATWDMLGLMQQIGAIEPPTA